MPIVSVRIPQMGEGLQEARLVEFLKNPGDHIKRDEPIYVMETDKAVTEVECPYEGTLVEWVSEPNAVLPIGTEVARMEVAQGVREITMEHAGPAASRSLRASDTPAAAPAASTAGVAAKTGNVPIPPRTRKYLRDKGLLEVADQIPALGGKLMPEDIDRYLAARATPAGTTTAAYTEQPLPQTQLTLNYRLKRGAEACVPATIVVQVDWENIAAAREQVRGTDQDETGFSMLLWCVAQVMKSHPGFRSTLSSDGKTLKTFEHVNLGVAVAIPGDLLRTAVVQRADAMSRAEFRESLKQQIEKVRQGADQIDATTTMTVSNIGAANVLLGVPVVVKPAVATLAVGEVFERPVRGTQGVEFRRASMLALTFDHLVVNGVGAANFLNELRQTLEQF